MPWEYSEEELITLCSVCHTDEHKRVATPVYRTENDKLLGESTDIFVCIKCGGDGYLPEYDYYENGKCFECNGVGFLKKSGIVH